MQNPDASRRGKAELCLVGVLSQQFRLLRRDRIADGNIAAGDHLGIDSAIGVAEPAHQRLRDREIALGGVGIDIDGGAADDALDHLEPTSPMASVRSSSSNSCQAGQPST